MYGPAERPTSPVAAGVQTKSQTLVVAPTLLLKRTVCRQEAVRAVRWNADGGYALTCGADKTIKLWQPRESKLLKTYMGHGYDVFDVDASWDNAQICSGGGDKAVFLWDVKTGNTVRRWRGHAGRVNAVRFNQEGSVVISASNDASVRIWDCKSRSGAPIQVLDDAKDGVICLCVHKAQILCGSADGCVRRYDIRKGQLHVDYIGQAVSSVCVSRDGACILVASTANSIRLFDVSTGELLNEYKGHRNQDFKLDACILASDDQVCSGSEDGAVHVWELVTARSTCCLKHPALSAQVRGDPVPQASLAHAHPGDTTPTVVSTISSHPTKCALLSATLDRMHLWVSPEDADD